MDRTGHEAINKVSDYSQQVNNALNQRNYYTWRLSSVIIHDGP
jgi:hypothetical protein